MARFTARSARRREARACLPRPRRAADHRATRHRSAPPAAPAAPGCHPNAVPAVAAVAARADWGRSVSPASSSWSLPSLPSLPDPTPGATTPGLYCTTSSSARARRSAKARRPLNDSRCILRFLFSIDSRVSSTTRLFNSSYSERVVPHQEGVDVPLLMQHVHDRVRVEEQLEQRVEEAPDEADQRRGATWYSVESSNA